MVMKFDWSTLWVKMFHSPYPTPPLLWYISEPPPHHINKAGRGREITLHHFQNVMTDVYISLTIFRFDKIFKRNKNKLLAFLVMEIWNR